MKNVVVVEDSKSYADWLYKDLKKIDELRVLGISDSVADAIQLINDSQPDLVIMDLMLTNGVGFELLDWIKRMDRDIEVYVMTSYALPSLKTRSLEHGASAFYDKAQDYYLMLDSLMERSIA